MGVFFNTVGFVVTLGAIAVVGHTFVVWQGILREGIRLFLYGFILFGVGFLWNILSLLGSLPDLEMAFFALGATFALFGARRIFSLQMPQNEMPL